MMYGPTLRLRSKLLSRRKDVGTSPRGKNYTAIWLDLHRRCRTSRRRARLKTTPDAMPPPEKMEHVGHAEIDFRTGFLATFRPPRSIRGDCQETVRFPGEPSWRPCPSPTCSVSMIVRRVARSRVRLNDRALSLK